MPVALLEPHVIARIAAGEVIDRPSSVVKELLENAIDAGATQISVDVAGSGLEIIRVSDDGCGMAFNDLELAFQRHATSKIRRFDDMFALSTLGFRGEALPSIAAVADVEITSCQTGVVGGAKLEFRDGKLFKKGAFGRSQGTSISAARLFQSVPARLKFLKSRPAENAHIAQVISQYAMAYPEIKFTLVSDGRQSMATAGNGKLADVLMHIYGLEVARQMLDITPYGGTASSAIKVSGMAATPAVTRSGNNFISLFINRRWVTSRRLVYAVEEAYHGMLMTGKHPIAVINIEIPSADIDVNIHPTKSEVKINEEAAVFGAVQRAVRQALVQAAPVLVVSNVTEAAQPAHPAPACQADFLLRQRSYTLSASRHAMPCSELGASQTAFAATPKTVLPALRLLGQLRNSYIVAEGPDGLYIIDQHAAHERVLFERFTREKSLGRLNVQALLNPEPFDVTPSQAALLSSHLDDLAQVGFLIESFGANSYIVRTVPGMLSDKNWKAMLSELLDTASGERSQFNERLVALSACHAAVRFGQALAEDEMRELLRQLEQVELPNTCPHGRPALMCLTYEQIGKEFKRA
ncbi:MAG: DNA mismatch repair endonuclease MutL [Dehalococcoidia bacterium]|nr:DNA mismatch repair endonuclease MutL [Dehalococcoidia bacterium]